MGAVQWRDAPARQVLERFVDDLSSAGSHDVKGAIRGINLLSEWLVEAFEDDAAHPALELVTQLSDRADQLRDAFEAILRYADRVRTPPAPGRCDIVAVAKAAVDGPGGATVTGGDHGAAVPVDVSASAVDGVLRELIGNAFLHANAEDVSVRIQREADIVRVCVDDDGVGVHPAYCQAAGELFGPDGAVARKPFGLGFTLCRSLVTWWGGEFGVVRRPDGGTRAWFTVPASAQG